MPASRRLATVFVLAALLLAGVGPTPVRSDESITFARVAPIIQKHCQGCHGPAKAKGDLRLDKLDPDMVKGSDGDRWREVHDRLNVGDMPPPGQPAMKKEDRELLTNWLVQERRRAALAKNPAAHFRRLTRREYERTLQDLLGLPIDFGSRLPEDGKSKTGFRNDGDALRMSPLQYETYLQIADEALDAAIVSGPAPAVQRFRFSGFEKQDKFEIATLPKPADRPGEAFEYSTAKGRAFRIFNSSASASGSGGNQLKTWTGTLPPSAIRRHGEAATQLPDHRISMGFHYAYRKGETRIRVRAARVAPPFGADPSRVPMLTVALGSSNFHGVELVTIGEPQTVDHEDFRTYEFKVRMENISPPNLGPLTDKNATILSLWNSAKAIKGEPLPPRLAVEWVEFENPYFEAWPPSTHTAILFPNKGLAEPAYAREVIRRFATRAYRGPVSEAELDRLVKHWEAARKDADTLEDSLKETLAVVISSPRFLALPASRSTGAKENLTDHELASRLSYFLWSTMPDGELLRLANESKLNDPAVRAAQIRRMIKDAKSWQFIEQFPEQWLELDRLQRVTVSKERYPGIDESLLAAMRLETIYFFGEVLREDMSIFQFLSSDFTCLNERLAAHYGIAGVEGPKFRKVALDKAQHRGGLLTHASILTGNSDGLDGHPIKRGMWLLKNLLDDPPPPPPPNVPELNRESPKLKNLTIPQALAAHRDNTACAGCHRKIDPWGLAFEEYDAVGNWQRDGAGAELRKRRTRNPVDAAVELPGGAKIDGMADLRAELIRTRADDFRRAMLRKVMAYALGRSLTLRDVEAADALVPALREGGDKFIVLIELIVGSEPFQSK
jgi:mono/diheme cytochrome c family protein